MGLRKTYALKEVQETLKAERAASKKLEQDHHAAEIQRQSFSSLGLKVGRNMSTIRMNPVPLITLSPGKQNHRGSLNDSNLSFKRAVTIVEGDRGYQRGQVIPARTAGQQKVLVLYVFFLVFSAPHFIFYLVSAMLRWFNFYFLC
jgi:hypothetical protein